MNSKRENIEWLKNILAHQKVSSVEEIVFSMTLARKLYREMAEETGYDEGYLKDVGSQLWSSLSEELGCTVNKKNLPLIVAQKQSTAKSLRISKKLHFPGYPLDFRSPLYIERPPVEILAINTLYQKGGLIRIKAPLRMGKTSLINRLIGIANQSGMQTVLVDMPQVEPKILNDLDSFFRWFCMSIGQQLTLQPQFEEYWFSDAGSKLSCTVYMQEYFLNKVEHPLVIAIDKIHHLFDYPQLATSFFSMLRSWYEKAHTQGNWQKLRMIISHSCELGLSLQANQSPFNVGLPLQLPFLTPSQIQDLAQRYQLNRVGIEDISTLEPLLQLVGGHPYLLQLAFYWLRSDSLSLTQLLEEASTPKGIYAEYLLQLWLLLEQDPLLKKGFGDILSNSKPISLDTQIAYRLEGLGLITMEGFKATPQCELYRRYFINLY